MQTLKSEHECFKKLQTCKSRIHGAWNENAKKHVIRYFINHPMGIKSSSASVEFFFELWIRKQCSFPFSPLRATLKVWCTRAHTVQACTIGYCTVPCWDKEVTGMEICASINMQPKFDLSTKRFNFICFIYVIHKNKGIVVLGMPNPLYGQKKHVVSSKLETTSSDEKHSCYMEWKS